MVLDDDCEEEACIGLCIAPCTLRCWTHAVHLKLARCLPAAHIRRQASAMQQKDRRIASLLRLPGLQVRQHHQIHWQTCTRWAPLPLPSLLLPQVHPLPLGNLC